MVNLHPDGFKVNCDNDVGKIKKRDKANERARRCRETRKVKMKQIAEKDGEDNGELLLEEENFKARQAQRLKVQREKIQKKRRLEKKKLNLISKSEDRFLLTGGNIEDLEFFLTDEEKRLKLKEDGRKKLNTENKRKKRLADKLILEEIQEKEEVVADVLEACAEIGMGDWDGNNDDCDKTRMVVEHAAVEYISALKIGVSREDLQFREKLLGQEVLYKERVRRMRSKRKESYGGKDGRKRNN